MEVNCSHAFCSTSLPQASTGWVRSTIEHFLHYPHSKQCTAIDKWHQHQEMPKILGTLKVKHRAAGGEARMLSTVLCRPPCSNILFVDALGSRNRSADGVPTWQSGACGFKSHQWLGFNLFTLSIALKCFSGSLLKSSTTNFACCKILTSADWVEPSLKQNEQTNNI